MSCPRLRAGSASRNTHDNHRAPSDRRPGDNHRPHSDLALSFLQVAVAASERALRSSQCPDLRRHLVECAHQNLAAARDLIRTDREWAA